MRRDRTRRALALTAAGLLAAGAFSSSALPVASGAGTWKATAKKLSIPVFRPAKTFGLRLGFARRIGYDAGCINDGRQQLRAFYGQQARRYLEIYEGHPRYCLDTGIRAPLVRTVKVRRARAKLYDLCGTRGCRTPGAANALDWCELGTTITLVGIGMPRKQLVAIARSMRQVDRGHPRPCAAS